MQIITTRQEMTDQRLPNQKQTILITPEISMSNRIKLMIVLYTNWSHYITDTSIQLAHGRLTR